MRDRAARRSPARARGRGVRRRRLRVGHRPPRARRAGILHAGLRSPTRCRGDTTSSRASRSSSTSRNPKPLVPSRTSAPPPTACCSRRRRTTTAKPPMSTCNHPRPGRRVSPGTDSCVTSTSTPRHHSMGSPVHPQRRIPQRHRPPVRTGIVPPHREVGDLRQAALAHQRQLEEAFDGSRVDRVPPAPRSGSTKTCSPSATALAAGEAQLGVRARTRAAMLEDELRRYELAMQDLERLQRSPFWGVLSRYLRLRTTIGGKLRRLLQRQD